MPAEQYISQYHMPLDPDVPEADRRMAEEVAEDYDRRRRNAAEARSDRLSEIAERSDREIREVLGEENWLSLRRRIRGERLRFEDLLQPPAGLTADYQALDAKRRANVQTYFHSLNVNAKELRRILDETKAEMQKLVPDIEADSANAAWLVEGQVPTAGDRDDPQAWSVFRPPFTSFYTSFGPAVTDGFQASRTHVSDPLAGLVGHDITLANTDARDLDVGSVIADTQVGLNYRAPKTGAAEIFIEAQCVRGRHELNAIDEFGSSQTKVTQTNFLMAHVLHPSVTSPSFAMTSRFTWDTDASETVTREFLRPGAPFWARLFSNGPVQLGQTVHIRVGTRGMDTAIAENMLVRSRSSFRWFLRAVWVRIAQ